MELQVKPRTRSKKLDAKRLLREGVIPAIVYSQGKEVETIAVEKSDFQKALRTIAPGHLPNTIFNLNLGKKHFRAIVKDIQYRRTNYEVIHLDFFELPTDVPVKVAVPVELTSVADCIGVKAGGSLRQVLRHVEVKAFAKNFPKSFSIDVSNLGVGQSVRLSDIEMPEGVESSMSPATIVVVVSK